MSGGAMSGRPDAGAVAVAHAAPVAGGGEEPVQDRAGADPVLQVRELRCAHGAATATGVALAAAASRRATSARTSGISSRPYSTASS